MKHFYSPSTGGFYIQEIHGNNIPSDATEVTEEHYSVLFAAQSSGKVIQPDDFGHPVAIDPPRQSIANMESMARAKRNALLAACDWTQLPDAPVADVSSWQVYRQALRDVPEQPGFPFSIEWPESPLAV
jgi:hypothetical protein